MDKKTTQYLRRVMKDLYAQPISEEHLAGVIRTTRETYQKSGNLDSITFSDFLARQVRFIGAPVWLLHGLLLLLILLIFGQEHLRIFVDNTHRLLPVVLCCFSVFTAMTGIPYIGHSARYKMLELEISTPASLRRLLSARILIIGIGNAVLLAISFLLVRGKVEYGIIRISVYLILPYVIASCGSGIIQLYVHGNFQCLGCIIFSFALVMLILVMYQVQPAIFDREAVGVWSSLSIASIISFALILHRLFNKQQSYFNL